MPIYRDVIFDLDGTLIDTLPGIEYSLLKSIKMVIPEKKQPTNISTYIGSPLREMISRLLPQEKSDIIDRVENSYRLIYDEVGWGKSQIYAKVTELLSWLLPKRVNCFVATNKRFYPTKQILMKFGLTQFFLDIVSPDSNGNFVSKESIVKYLVEKHSLEAKHILMVGDSSEDISAAKALRIDLAYAEYGYGKIKSFAGMEPVGFLHEPDDLRKYFLEIGNE